MYLLQMFLNTEAFSTILLAIVTVLGDWLVSISNLDIYKAIFDNSTHSIIGGLTWLIVSLRIKQRTVLFRLSEVCLCAIIASIIDLDHFLMARSFHLKDATNLQSRPPFHCTTFPLVVTTILLVVSKYLASENLYRFSWIFFAAFISHHIRDATRRGLWFYQLGSTPPIPYYLYVSLTVAIPYFVSYCMRYHYQHKTFVDTLYV